MLITISLLDGFQDEMRKSEKFQTNKKTHFCFHVSTSIHHV